MGSDLLSCFRHNPEVCMTDDSLANVEHSGDLAVNFN